MVTLFPHASITLSQRRWSCVLDPVLLLSPYGLLLVQSLGDMLELWVARELWHILDNPDFYANHPECVMPQLELDQSSKWQTAQQKRRQILKRWEWVRARTPPTHLNLFWLGDRMGESFLPDGTHPHLLMYWEALARALDEQLQQPISGPVLASAYRDTVALAAVLGSAFILTCQPVSRESGGRLPEICQVLEQWRIPCQQIDPLRGIAAMEREHLLQQVISTGFSKFLWAGLHLAVLHLVVPSACTMPTKIQSPYPMLPSDEADHLEASQAVNNAWEGAQGFWYEL